MIFLDGASEQIDDLTVQAALLTRSHRCQHRVQVCRQPQKHSNNLRHATSMYHFGIAVLCYHFSSRQILREGESMVREISLTRGAVALIDDEDWVWAAQWKWHVCDGHARRKREKEDRATLGLWVHMHRAEIERYRSECAHRMMVNPAYAARWRHRKAWARRKGAAAS